MVTVQGATLAGLAAAARLARLGHEVTLATQGVALETISVEGDVLLPAAWRDLFKKSGAHLVTALNGAGLELTQAPPVTHRLADGDTLSLPAERGAQWRALEAQLGPEAAASWRDLLDDLDDVWTAFRCHALEGTVPVTTAAQRSALWLDRSLADLSERLPGSLRPLVLATGPSPAAPGLLALSLSVERSFGRWQVTDQAGSPRPATDLVTLLIARLVERGVTIVAEFAGTVDIDCTEPDPGPPASAQEWLDRAPIVGPDGALRASAASPAGPQPWAQLGSAALAVYELHERLTGEDPRPTNVAFTLPRL